MSFCSAQRRMVATVGALATLLIGAATLYAAVGWQRAGAAPRVGAATSGPMSLTSSKQEGAIFDLTNIAPGNSGTGEVTISNTGSAPGALSLASVGLTDALGRFGGTLSERLLLRLEAIGSAGQATELYDGQLGAMPELRLGTLATGASRTFRFVITMLDGGSPSTPFVDDNIYQRARTGIGYEWTLTESEGGDAESVPPDEPPAPTPIPTPKPAAPSPPTKDPPPAGTARADNLVGTSGDDTIFGRGGADRIYGKGGRDHLDGGAGADHLYGGAGADRLRGGKGTDHLNGGSGADRIFSHDGGADLVNCGPGRDVADADGEDRLKSCERVHIH